MGLRGLLLLVVAWGALFLAVGQLACSEEHHAGDGLEAAACLVLAVVAVTRTTLPTVRRVLRACALRPTELGFVTLAVGLSADAVRGSPRPASSPLRC